MRLHLIETLVFGSVVLSFVDLHAEDNKPNVILIVCDDLGWGDVEFNGDCDIPTPNLNRLAQSGVVMDAGYATHPYCSPSRAGLLTGRYQQRFGHECNPSEGDDTSGLPFDQVLLPELLHPHGYRTGAIGKWHLGDAPKYWPTERGFHEWYGFSGGALNYWGTAKQGKPKSGVLRDGMPVDPKRINYLTDDFTSEAIGFVQRNREQPFFLYLAYNAPHAPDHATENYLKKVEHIEYGGRAVYAAMVVGMDAGIGRLLDTLETLKLRENTIVIFYSDNGGRSTHANNLPYRGHKGMLFEGGIRVPFCISWPSVLPNGMRYPNMVSALDIYPTVLAACGIANPTDAKLDGVNIVPHLTGPSDAPPHDSLFWRYAVDEEQYGYAVRQANMKLVISQYKNCSLLFDLANDPGERHDLVHIYPETAERLEELIRLWDTENQSPRWLDPHGKNVRKERNERERIIQESLPPKFNRDATLRR
ncbi:sulfatase-like hydrolase/transferase [Calycomorphotria hydatis]|uniref:Arylsulfatase n=1 Tax=Calycomorphotria hydatis TaxID=2528027 RepID=A0A517T5C2_9PLAN|nr:sulfatase-like hydrolase/transferase [Calycomorphotria hydatis]QDT63570.1 Arylsulfatase precursor [Calycomorphotria hydatis]